MYNDTITLFNRYESKQGDTWYPSILHNCNLNMDKASIIAKYGSDSQDNAVLNVQYSLKDGKKMVGSKLWLQPKEWSKRMISCQKHLRLVLRQTVLISLSLANGRMKNRLQRMIILTDSTKR